MIFQLSLWISRLYFHHQEFWHQWYIKIQFQKQFFFWESIHCKAKFISLSLILLKEFCQILEYLLAANPIDIIAGDFNSDLLKVSTNNLLDCLKEYFQIVNEVTHNKTTSNKNFKSILNLIKLTSVTSTEKVDN